MLHDQDLLNPTTANLEFMPEEPGYLYFEPGPQRSLLLDAAEASMLSYARSPRKRLSPEEFTRLVEKSGLTLIRKFGDFFVDEASGARGFFAANGDRALLALRGTEADNPFDLAADGNLIPVADKRIPQAGVLVHMGFREYLDQIWDEVIDAVTDYRTKYPANDICFTGHSLGGALATLSFAYLRDPQTSLYTFGCPRVGNRAFCDQFNSAPNKAQCRRVVDGEDIVTHIPLTYRDTALGRLVFHNWGYVHPDIELYWLDQKGRILRNPDLRDSASLSDLVLWYPRRFFRQFSVLAVPGPLADHSPVRYCHWIAQGRLQDSN